MTELRRSDSAHLERFAGAPLARGVPAPDLAGYAGEHVALAARAWTMKAEEEYRSAALFNEIVRALIHRGAPLDLQSAFGRVVSDELAHATLCLDLAARFGAPVPRLALERVTARVDVGVVMLVLFEGAIGETVSAALFHAGRSGTREPCTRAALGIILADEARHARLCWRAAELLITDRDALDDELARSFAWFERDGVLPALRRLDAGEMLDDELVALGVIPPERRVEAFYRTIERVVIPRLAMLGLDGQRAWDRRYRVPTP